MRERSFGPIMSPSLGIASLVIGLTAVGYVRLLGQQGSLPGIDARIALVMTLLVGYAILSGVGAFASSTTVRATTAAACAGGLLPLGFLAAFSIGIPLLAAGAIALLVWVGTLRGYSDRRTTIQSVGAGVASIVVLAVGLVATGRQCRTLTEAALPTLRFMTQRDPIGTFPGFDGLYARRRLRLPIFLVADDSRVQLCSQVDEALGFVEAQDVRDGVYEAFDADGVRLGITAESDDSPVIISESHTFPPEPEKLRGLLRDDLVATHAVRPELFDLSYESLSEAELPVLVAEMQTVERRFAEQSALHRIRRLVGNVRNRLT